MSRLLYITAFFFLAVCSAAAQNSPVPSSPVSISSSPPAMQTSPDEPGSNKPRSDQKTSAADADPSAPKPVILKPGEPTDQQRRSRASKGGCDGIGTDVSAHGSTEQTIANFTIALAFATIMLMFFTGALWWETRRLANLAKQQAKDTEKSLEIAATAANAASVTASSNRAWLIFSGIEYKPAGTIADGVKKVVGYLIDCKIKNSGMSPAVKVSSYSEKVTIDDGQALPVFYENIPDGVSFQGTMGQSVEYVTSHVMITNEEVEGIRQGRLQVLIFTFVSYNDVFNPETERRTVSCQSVLVQGDHVLQDGRTVAHIALKPVGSQNICD